VPGHPLANPLAIHPSPPHSDSLILIYELPARLVIESELVSKPALENATSGSLEKSRQNGSVTSRLTLKIIVFGLGQAGARGDDGVPLCDQSRVKRRGVDLCFR